MSTATTHAYVVLNENTLGIIKAARPGWLEVLAGSVIRGGHSHLNGPVWLCSRDVQRPATLADFTSFRVCPKGHIA